MQRLALTITFSAIISLTTVLNSVSVFSACWNSIQMLMSRIPMDFSLLCHRYHLHKTQQHSPPRFLSVFVSLVLSNFHSLSGSKPCSQQSGTKLVVPSATFPAGINMHMHHHQVMQRLWKINCYFPSCQRCYFPMKIRWLNISIQIKFFFWGT